MARTKKQMKKHRKRAKGHARGELGPKDHAMHARNQARRRAIQAERDGHIPLINVPMPLSAEQLARAVPADDGIVSPMEQPDTRLFKTLTEDPS